MIWRARFSKTPACGLARPSKIEAAICFSASSATWGSRPDWNDFNKKLSVKYIRSIASIMLTDSADSALPPMAGSKSGRRARSW